MFFDGVKVFYNIFFFWCFEGVVVDEVFEFVFLRFIEYYLIFLFLFCIVDGVVWVE